MKRASLLLPFRFPFLVPFLFLTVLAGAAPAQVIDDCEQTGAWKALASDGVTATLHGAPGKEGAALRLDFDFGGAAGYAALRRTLPLVFGDDYEISLWVRAEAPLNNLELKLVDASGENVWWVNRPDLAIGPAWRQLTFKKRDVAFAWGPAADRVLRRSEYLELVVSAGRDGGKGAIWFDQLALRPLAPAGPLPEPTLASSSSSSSSLPSAAALLAGAAGWASEAGGGPHQQLTVDFGRPREFGGLVLHWAPGRHARRYDIDFSDDGANWRTVRQVEDGNGGADPLLLGESATRFVRLAMHAGPASAYRLERLEVKPLAFGASANAFFQALAATAPAGRYPRAMAGRQNYWTVVGVDGGGETALLSEDGALEVARGGFTIEPFVVAGAQRSSWADVTLSQSLRENYLPIPSVLWQAPAWTLRSTAFATGTARDAQLIARYELHNTSAAPLSLRLELALRPFQVNPPTQFLNTVPGVSPIADIAWDGAVFSVNGRRRVLALQAPSAAGVSSFDAGEAHVNVTANANAGAGAPAAVHDPSGFASGVLAYDVHLAPHEMRVVALAIPLTGATDGKVDALTDPLRDALREPLRASLRDLQAAEDAVAAAWRARLNRVAITLPPAGRAVTDTLRSSLAHMLITREGPMLRPGTRSYARSWIRDGAMMSEAMLRLGDDTVARDYFDWYAQRQFANGKVPCCVDRRGADPVPENDSQGEFVFLAAQLWKYGHDRALLERGWPRVQAAVAYMEAQRQSERRPANAGTALYGLLPASISHEGYSAKPMHSYWDDFWGLRGYRDAALMARALGLRAQADTLARQGAQFEGELLASLRRGARAHHIGYLAGAAELGDFDATSTTIALSPGGLQQRLPQDLLLGTFEHYWERFAARRDGRLAWDDYTPYELRNVAAFVRLGWGRRAHALLDFFLRDRRPLAWNQWAEVVGRDARAPRFVGDMPHGWISSDFIRSTLDLFAYEREADRALVLGAGVPPAWLDGGGGVSVRALRTGFGPLTLHMRRRRDGVVAVDVGAAIALPPGGVVLQAFDADARPGAATINGRPARWRGRELRIRTLPAHILIQPSPTSKARS